MALFSISCATCNARLAVRDVSAIGQILECPKCGSMVMIEPPDGWQPPKKKDEPVSLETTPPETSDSSTEFDLIAPPLPGSSPSAWRGDDGSTESDEYAIAEGGLDLEALSRRFATGASVAEPAPADAAPADSPRRQPTKPQATPQPNAADDRFEPAASPGTSTTEQRVRRWTMIGGGVAAGLVVALTLWSFLARDGASGPIATGNNDIANQDIVPKDVLTKDLGKQQPSDTPPKTVAKSKIRPAGDLIRWLPDRTQSVLSLRLAELSAQPGVTELLSSLGPLWQQGIYPLTEGLSLPLADVERLTVASADLTSPVPRSLVVIRLSKPLNGDDLEKLRSGAAVSELKLGEAVCYHRTDGPWPKPYAVVDPQTIVTGPIDLLEELAERESRGKSSPADSPLIEQLETVGTDRQVTLVADMESVRRAQVGRQPDWLAAGEADREAWSTIRAATRVFAMRMHVAKHLDTEFRFACTSEGAAKEVQTAITRLIRAAPDSLKLQTAWLRRQSESEKVDADLAKAADTVLTHAADALQAGESGAEGQTAWARSSLEVNVRELASPAVATLGQWDKLLAGMSTAVAQAPPNQGVDPPPGKKDRIVPAVNAIARLQLKPQAVEYVQKPLAGFVANMAQLTGVPITLDVDALADAGLGPETKITVRQKDATVAEVLRVALAEVGLGYVVDGGGLLVTTPEGERSIQRMVEYDVADLAADRPALTALGDLARQMVAPEAWQARGGAGTLEIVGGKFRVRQSGSAHEALLEFFERLRVARGRPTLQLPGLKLDTRFARAEEKLARPVSANFFQETPLSKITDYLAGRANVRILIDSISLRKAGLTAADKITFTVEKKPLFVALTQLTDSLDIGFRIVDADTLQIVSRQDAAADLELEFYPIAELLTARTDEQLAAELQTRIAPATWSVRRGPGQMHFDAASRCLLVLQTQAVQIQVDTYLFTERAKRTAKPEAGADAKGP